MKIVSDISITSRIVQGRGSGAPVVISATVRPVLGSLRDGDSVQLALSPGALDAGNYASTEGAITAVTVDVTINGLAADIADGVAISDTVSVTVTVTDAAGNARLFDAGTQVVSGLAPVAETAPIITGTPAPGAAVTITQGTYAGTPAPTVTGTLTLDGCDVTADLSGSDYTVPSSATLGSVLAYAETGVNGVYPDATQGTSVTIVAAETALLDAYPGAIGAWSLRKLSGSISAVVRVRRSNDSAEADFAADAVADGSLVAWVGSGNDGYVARLFDQSGNGHAAVQPVTGKQPKVVDNGVLVTDGGKPSVLYSLARETSLTLPVGVHSLSSEPSKTIISVFNLMNTVEFARPFYFGSGGSSNITLRTGTSTSILTFNGFSNTVSFDLTSGTRYIVWAEDLSGTQSIYVDGVLRASNTSGGTRSSNDALIGGYLTSNFWGGTISEVISYPSDQSSARSVIENDLVEHYGGGLV
jgi:hypothetical protein